MWQEEIDRKREALRKGDEILRRGKCLPRACFPLYGFHISSRHRTTASALLSLSKKVVVRRRSCVRARARTCVCVYVRAFQYVGRKAKFQQTGVFPFCSPFSPFQLVKRAIKRFIMIFPFPSSFSLFLAFSINIKVWHDTSLKIRVQSANASSFYYHYC